MDGGIHMKRAILIVFGFIMIGSLSFPGPSTSAEPDLGGGRISLTQGQVLLSTRDKEEWTEASVNFPLEEGDRLLTERDGRAELQFENGTYVRIGEGSQVDVVALTFDGGREVIHFNQFEGRTYVNYRLTSGADSLFLVDLPYGSVIAPGPSKFRIDLNPSEGRVEQPAPVREKLGERAPSHASPEGKDRVVRSSSKDTGSSQAPNVGGRIN
jgi:hypothetical protein